MVTPNGIIDIDLVCCNCHASYPIRVDTTEHHASIRNLIGKPLTSTQKAIISARDILFEEDWYLHDGGDNVIATCPDCNAVEDYDFNDTDITALLCRLLGEK